MWPHLLWVWQGTILSHCIPCLCPKSAQANQLWTSLGSVLFCNIGGATLIKLVNSPERTLPGSFLCFLWLLSWCWDVCYNTAQSALLLIQGQPTQSNVIVSACHSGWDSCPWHLWMQRLWTLALPWRPPDSQSADGSLSLGLPPICLHSAQGCGREKSLWFPPPLHTL